MYPYSYNVWLHSKAEDKMNIQLVESISHEILYIIQWAMSEKKETAPGNKGENAL